MKEHANAVSVPLPRRKSQQLRVDLKKKNYSDNIGLKVVHNKQIRKSGKKH